MHLPRSRRSWFVAVALGLVLVIAATACDDGSGKESTKHRRSTTTSTKPAAGTSSTSATTAPADPSAGATTTVPVPAGTCGGQTAAIVAAIQEDDPDLRTGYAAPSCQLAASAPTWALARFVPSAGSAAPPRTVALERVGALWTVRAKGNDANVCDGIPHNIGAELLGPSCRG